MKDPFSRRVKPESGTETGPSYAPEAELNQLAQAKGILKASGQSVLDLCRSNPTQVGLDYPGEDILQALSGSASLTYSPSPAGVESARFAVSEYYRARGRETSSEDFILTASSSESYAFLFKLLCDPGDEVLIPSPSYPLFDFIAQLENVKLLRYPLLQNRESDNAGTGVSWTIDFSALSGLISQRTRAIICVHPNNPTGSLLNAEEIEALLQLTAQAGIPLIVDEVFADYALAGNKYLPIISEGSLVFTLNGFSKTLGLPQLKLGWIHMGGDAEMVCRAKEHLETIADTFLSVNTPVQAACSALLALRSIIQERIHHRLKENLDIASDIINGRSAMRLLRPQAGWGAILEFPAHWDDEALALTLLQKKKVYTHPGYLFDMEIGCRLIVSLLTPPWEFRIGMEALAEYSETLILSGGEP